MGEMSWAALVRSAEGRGGEVVDEYGRDLTTTSRREGFKGGEIDFKSLVKDGVVEKVVSYEVGKRVFYEPADVVYGDIDLYPSTILVPEEDLYPKGE